MTVPTELITSNVSTVGLFSLLITLSIGLVKVIEFLIKKAMPKKKVLSEDESNIIADIATQVESLLKKREEDSESLKEQYEWVHEMYRMHNKVDGDGIPLWYVPRTFIETQKEIVSILLNISAQMDKSTYVLDSLLKRLEEIERQIRDYDKLK